MPKQVTIAGSNMYCKARLKAAKYNPDFSTRVRAAEYLSGISEDSLKKYELGITKVSNDVVAIMADAYNEPELIYEYCAKECPLGIYSRVITDSPPERTLIRLINAHESMRIAIEMMKQILDDGELSAEELKMLPELKSKILEVKQRLEETLVLLERAERRRNLK